MRHSDWEARLNQVVENLREEPLIWGVNDCFTFVNACHYALTEEFLAEEWMGKYSTAFEAKIHYARKLKATGNADIISAIDTKLTRVNSIIAPRGSVVARQVEDEAVMGYALGVVVSDKIAFLTAQGLDFVTPSDGDVFWSVD